MLIGVDAFSDMDLIMLLSILFFFLYIPACFLLGGRGTEPLLKATGVMLQCLLKKTKNNKSVFIGMLLVLFHLDKHFNACSVAGTGWPCGLLCGLTPPNYGFHCCSRCSVFGSLYVLPHECL